MAVEGTIHNTYGILFQAAVYSAMLFGVALTQAWNYFRAFHKRDSLYVQGLVAAVIVCDVCQIAFLCAALYDWLLLHQGDPTYLAVLPKTLIIELFFSALIAVGVQQFYCYRIWMLSKSYVIAGAVSAVSLSAFVTLLIYSVQALGYNQMIELGLLQKMSTITNSLAAVTDIVISIVMVALLQRSKTGFKKTTDLVNKLIIFTFNAGLPTSVCALVAVVTINAAPSTFLYIFFFVLMGRFYTNSILVTLNSREYIRQAATESNGTNAGNSFSLPVMSRGPGHNGQRSRNDGDAIAIRIDTNTVHDHDAHIDSKTSSTERYMDSVKRNDDTEP